MFLGKVKKGGKISSHKKENLIPVVSYGKNKGVINVEDNEEIIVLNPDAHFDEDKENIEQKIIAEKIFEKAKEMQRNINKRGGKGSGSLFSQIEELYKPKVNWKKEINKLLNVYYSNNCNLTKEKPSFITYPWNPKSRYGILCKHRIEEIQNIQKYIIIAIDTSGSIFFDKEEVKTFFSEMESLAKWLSFSKEGKIFTVQWDYDVVEGLKEYEKGNWKNFKLKGGGGTRPHSVFNYLSKIYLDKKNHFIINENGIKIIIPDKKKLPFLLFLTDGYFAECLRIEDLGVYKDSSKNISFLTNNNYYLYKDAQIIRYDKSRN
jgi:predicted metal-dependent peptidase